MDFPELKKKAKEELEIQEPEVVKDNPDALATGQIDVNPTQKMIFSLSQFRNKKYFDIRHWLQAESGEWTPTKKGIHLSLDKFGEFETAVRTLAAIVALDQ